MFWKKDKKPEKEKETPREFKSVGTEKADEAYPQHTGMLKFTNFKPGVLKNFYVSEKSSLLNTFSQYVFKVFDSATKNEIRKQVEKSFNVKVKDVKIINLPGKARTVGRHSGFKPGFKKAIVVLEKGYSIDQAKA